MKRLLVVIALLAFVPLARAEQQQPKKQTKGKPQAAQRAATAPASAGRVQGTGGRRKNTNVKPVHSNAGAPTNVNRTHLNRTQTNVANQTNATGVTRNKVGAVGTRRFVTGSNNVGTVGARRFVTGGNNVSFAAARNFNWHARHDRGWWDSQGFPLVLYGGGYWFWNNGWWYPAYGYDPYYNNYVYDGPIYGYGNVAPGDVTSEVQQALADQGYYRGPIDGVLGSMTRRAIERFQADHGLAVTAAIDQPTLSYLGLA